MTSSMRMEEDQSHMTERILNFTLEIIYLLTGESLSLLKCGEQLTITVLPCDSLKPKRPNKQKVLEVTQKMMELLTGESENFQDENIGIKEEFKEEDEEYGVMKEPDEGHKDLTTEPPSNINSPERCPSPLYSHRDPTQGGQCILHDDQSANLSDLKLDVLKEEEEVMEESTFHTGHKVKDEMVESSNFSNPQERCPHPLYFHQDPTKIDISIPQGEDVMDIKVEGEVEEMCVRDDQQYMKEAETFKDEEEEEAGMTRTFKEEDTPTQISTVHGQDIRRSSEDRLMLPPACEVEDKDITQYSPGENAVTRDVQLEPGSVSGPSYSSSPEEPQTVRDGEVLQTDKRFSCPECGKCFRSKYYLNVHIRTHTGEKPYSCTECGKCFRLKKDLHTHITTHMGMKPHSCAECGESFSLKSYLSMHQKSHTGEKSYSCSVCGKCFPHRSNLSKHQKSHMVEKLYSCSECGKCSATKRSLKAHLLTHKHEKPYSCSECGKCFASPRGLKGHKSTHTGEKCYPCSECGKSFVFQELLTKHLRSHTGERPYCCSECGKCFTQQAHLTRHHKTHTGEKPYSCSECGKSFSQKYHLSEHQISHVGVRAYSCPDCGKCFLRKLHLSEHLISHTGARPFACSECGKRFVVKRDLERHQTIHTGKKPYSCSECGKCYTAKGSLSKHQKVHTGEMP